MELHERTSDAERGVRESAAPLLHSVVASAFYAFVLKFDGNIPERGVKKKVNEGLGLRCVSGSLRFLRFGFAPVRYVYRAAVWAREIQHQQIVRDGVMIPRF